MEVLGGLTIILALLGLVVAVLWILLPFAVFGMKDLAKELILKQETTNKLLRQIIEQSENNSVK